MITSFKIIIPNGGALFHIPDACEFAFKSFYNGRVVVFSMYKEQVFMVYLHIP